MIEDYSTVDGTFEIEAKIKGSRFIAVVMPCPTEKDIPKCLQMISEKYSDATHYCYAAVFDGSSRKMKSSDNGEPGGTAGVPILSALQGSGLSDLICVVVRYFGGTLLGVGGLVHAYGGMSTIAMERVRTRKRVACSVFDFALDYSMNKDFETQCKGYMACKPKCEYTDKVYIRAWVPVGLADEFVEKMTDLTNRRLVLQKMFDEYI